MLKLISINIEGDRHLDTVIPFLQKEQPDVFAVQELFKERILDIEQGSGMKLICFYPMHTGSNIAHEGLKDTTLGIGIFSNLETVHVLGKYYSGDETTVPKFAHNQDPRLETTIGSLVPNSSNLVVAGADFKKEGTIYRILTTHFTYTRDGIATAFQLEDLAKMFQVLNELGDFTLVGDFNAPRGRETWNRLAAKYKDNIPLSYTSSLDPVMHKAADQKLPYVVDGCFTTAEYTAKDVVLVSGVSDHMAVVATLEKNVG